MMFRESIGMLVPDAIVLTEELGNWECSHRRIDLLSLDRS